MKVKKSSRALMGWLPACIGLIAALSLVGCAPLAETPGDAPAPAAPTADLPESSGLSEEEAAALSSLEKVDDYPLYSMHFTGDYELRAAVNPVLGHFVDDLPASRLASWGCSLFASLADPENLLYGRNFDWEYSPALLLFTDPPQGYASVSMVDIAYLGYAGEEAKTLTALPLAGRKGLLDAPFLPFDGMNEHGLVVGMAAVPSGNMPPDPKKETVGSLGVIRKILDEAKNVDEAVTILGNYNIDFQGGPPIHYLIADRSGRAILVEFYRGKMQVLPNEQPWHQATNFLRSSVGESAAGQCWRYDKLDQALSGSNGRINGVEALGLLESVAQDSTQWSVLYGFSTGEIHVVMGQKYDQVHTFELQKGDQE